MKFGLLRDLSIIFSFGIRKSVYSTINFKKFVRSDDLSHIIIPRTL